MTYKIHPSVGVARVGNSNTFYLSPTKIGGRPIECNKFGDEITENNETKFVKKFKDSAKRVKKQAAKFYIYKHDDDNPKTKPVLVDLTNKNEIKSIKWTVHLANKKSAWYEFEQYAGDVMIGPGNTYEEKGISKRNSEKEERKDLLIDFGPRTLDSPKEKLPFKNNTTVPVRYTARSPKWKEPYPTYGRRVDYLGEIITDSKCNLVVLGGHGNSGGDVFYSSFGGADSWYDDMSDGPVICEIILADGKDTKITLDAWIIVGPPKFAPELVNITTLDDLMLDVAAYNFGATPEFFDKQKWPESNGWNQDYKVNFERDIEPIIKRIGCYRWVANVPSMMDFCTPSFDLKDNSDANLTNRQNYLSYFRKSGEKYTGLGGQSEELFKNNDYLHGIPLMPLNSGSNAINNDIIDKFVELSRIQYYFMEQWAKGKFTTDKAEDILGMIELDHADVGNSVGSPMCPGVEVTWSVKNPAIYAEPYRIKHKTLDTKYYFEHGLDPDYDETAPEGQIGAGCEPGDLTKRMAIPWTSDLFECNIQHINFTDTYTNSTDKGIEEPPTYLSYWWPPQSPWDVILGVTDPEESDARKQKEKVIEELRAAGASAGQQVNYIRGITNHIEMAYAWSYLGFIVNQNESPDRDQYPYFVEKERNHEEFEVSALAIGNKINVVDPFSTKFTSIYHLKKDILEFSKSEGSLNVS